MGDGPRVPGDGPCPGQVSVVHPSRRRGCIDVQGFVHPVSSVDLLLVCQILRGAEVGAWGIWYRTSSSSLASSSFHTSSSLLRYTPSPSASPHSPHARRQDIVDLIKLITFKARAFQALALTFEFRYPQIVIDWPDDTTWHWPRGHGEVPSAAAARVHGTDGRGVLAWNVIITVSNGLAGAGQLEQFLLQSCRFLQLLLAFLYLVLKLEGEKGVRIVTILEICSQDSRKDWQTWQGIRKEEKTGAEASHDKNHWSCKILFNPGGWGGGGSGVSAATEDDTRTDISFFFLSFSQLFFFSFHLKKKKQMPICPKVCYAPGGGRGGRVRGEGRWCCV